MKEYRPILARGRSSTRRYKSTGMRTAEARGNQNWGKAFDAADEAFAEADAGHQPLFVSPIVKLCPRIVAIVFWSFVIFNALTMSTLGCSVASMLRGEC